MLKIKFNNLLIIKKNFFLKNKVKNILNDIKLYGEHAFFYYIKNIDGIYISSIKKIIIKKKELKNFYYKLNYKKKKIIKEIYIRLKRYHFHNYTNSWQIKIKEIIYGNKITPIEKICIYIPGGNTIYPSSIFMNAIPSLIYKPNFILMITPIKNGIISNLILAISYICNISEILFSGGVHALSCAVFGTKNINKINKITGPGNFYISQAKKFFFGITGIDMIAGPSELIILNDKFIHPKIIIHDFFSQLEHDFLTKVYLLCNNKKFLILILKLIFKILLKQYNKKIIFKALNNCYLIFSNISNSIEIINFCAPEHLMLCIKKPNKILYKIKNCGAIFINYYTNETCGDYVIGPSHVLPTNKTTKFFSSLNINDFCKKISIIKITNAKYSNKFSSFFSKKEKFFSHSYSSNYRL